MTTEGRSRNRKCIRRILLVRHGMSVGNLDESIYQVLPDQAIPLSFMGPIEVNGEKQALSAGEALRRFYDELSEREDDVRVVLVHSPFKRARQTAQLIEQQMGEHVFSTSMNVHLGEQDFGIFEGKGWDQLQSAYPHAYTRYKKAAAFKSRFWCRVPLGESRYDVCKRVCLAFSSLHRESDRNDITDFVIVAHGVSIRAFLMMWLHKSPEWLERSVNPNNCSIRLLDNRLRQEDKDLGYIYPGFPRVKRAVNEATELLAGSGSVLDLQQANAQPLPAPPKPVVLAVAGESDGEDEVGDPEPDVWPPGTSSSRTSTPSWPLLVGCSLATALVGFLVGSRAQRSV